jgi:hypothetical protein
MLVSGEARLKEWTFSGPGKDDVPDFDLQSLQEHGI